MRGCSEVRAHVSSSSVLPHRFLQSLLRSLSLSPAQLYYHSAFYGGAGGTGNQLTELIPVDRSYSQLGAFIKAAKNSTIFIDNISDLRPAGTF